MRHAADDANAFCWVDDYIAHVRPHFEVRPEDSLLIVMPNKAVKLNATGLSILQFLKGGGSIQRVLGGIGENPERRREVFHFLCDFRSLMTGCLGEGGGRKAVQVIAHSAMPFNTLPVLSEIAVTYRCNLRCRFCYAACGCQGTRGSTREMTTREAIRVLEVIRRDAKVPSVSFTGGEPTLREDLEDLIAAAHEIGLRTNLITNAAQLAGNDCADRLRAAGLVSAQVSLEGPNEEIHDDLTGVGGSFERTLEGLQALRRAGVHTHTNTTINALNADHLEGLVRLVAELGLARMSANMVIPAGSAADRTIQIPYSRLGEIVLPMREVARQYGVEFLWYSPTPMCIFNPLASGLGNKSCAACDGLLSVSPTGEVLPCSSYPQPVGSLLAQPFDEVWNSARAMFFRRKDYAPAECSGCEEFGPCAGACPLYWSAMGTAELAGAGRVVHATA
jgi:radical SAM protein with 4Fe4S-binding SPASM domain